MSELSRRTFLKTGACVIGGLCAGGALPEPVAARQALAHPMLSMKLPYPRLKLSTMKQLKLAKELQVSYPDKDSPVRLLKLGRKAIHGVGPDCDIVAFSQLCSHMGGSLTFRPETGALHCPLHYAMFDPAKGGLTIIGQATDNLPQIQLEIDEKGNIFAVGVLGLIYGRQANILG